MERTITDDLELLLAALPPHICEPLKQREDNFELLEVVMDLGRRPEARYPGREVTLAQTEVTSEDIDYVVSRIEDSATTTVPALNARCTASLASGTGAGGSSD